MNPRYRLSRVLVRLRRLLRVQRCDFCRRPARAVAALVNDHGGGRWEVMRTHAVCPYHARQHEEDCAAMALYWRARRREMLDYLHSKSLTPSPHPTATGAEPTA